MSDVHSIELFYDTLRKERHVYNNQYYQKGGRRRRGRHCIGVG
jgi:hypothetical protein